MARRQELSAGYPESVSRVFGALGRTLSFRRWGPLDDMLAAARPEAGLRYRCAFGSVSRVGRIVEVTRPVGLTLKEVLHDPPCRVSLTLRCRVEPVSSGSRLRLNACYRLNRAAWFRKAHWDRRLQHHFRNQLAYVAVNLDRVHDVAAAKRDTQHL